MSNWVTLDDVKHHLRYDDDSNDATLSMYIAGAEAAVNNYITNDVTPNDTPDIKIAVLLLIGYYDEYRNLTNNMPTSGNYLPEPIRAQLYPYRKPTAI